MKTKLAEMVGAEYLFDSLDDLKPFASDYSLSPPRMPSYVARPKSVEEVQGIIKLANEHKMPVVPSSSGVHFNGATLPNQGGIIIDLSRMNDILEVDERNRKVRIAPGVTWGQLQSELEKHELMALIPLLPHPQKSAITSHLEREPMLISRHEYGEPLLTMEVVFPNGDLFRTGSACVPGATVDAVAEGVQPEGPGLDWFRFFQGAQGTMGVVTWANVKVEYLPKVNKPFFLPFERIEDAIEPIYRIGRRMIGQECLLLNSFNLAAILAEKWPDDFENLRGILPPWTLILVLAGGRKYPEEKTEYEEEALREVGSELSLPNLWESLPGVHGLERRLPKLLRQAWPEDKTYWKFAYKGSCQDLFFHTTLDKVSEFVEALCDLASRCGRTRDELGFYLQPLERGRACHFECNFYYDPNNLGEVGLTRMMYKGSAELLLEMGAFFTRPYGILADLVYERAAGYTSALKKLKGLLDPNNIMAPGKLCF